MQDRNNPIVVTANRAAEVLGITRQCVLVLARRGRLGGSYKEGDQWLMDYQGVLSYRQEKTVRDMRRQHAAI